MYHYKHWNAMAIAYMVPCAIILFSLANILILLASNLSTHTGTGPAWILSEMNTTCPSTLHKSIHCMETRNLILKELALKPGMKGEERRIFWDMFIRDGQLFFIIPRYSIRLNPLSIHVTVPGVVDKLKMTNIIRRTFKLPMEVWYVTEPNDVLVGVIRNNKLRKLIDSQSSIDVMVSLPSMGVNKTYTLSHSGLQRQIHTRGAEVVGSTIIGKDISIKALSTWIKYHQLIGMEYFIVYFLTPVTILPLTSCQELNHIALECGFCFTVAQWHPYHVSGPHPIRGDQPASYLGFINSVLYRLKFESSAQPVSKLDNFRPRQIHGDHDSRDDLYLAILDTDDFLVVHPNFTNLVQMKRNYNATSAIMFHNIYFYLMQNHSNIPIQSDEFTLDEMKYLPMVHETNINLHTYRAKIMFSTKRTVIPAAHDIMESSRGSWRRSSNSFYFHYIKQSKGRNATIIQQASQPTNVAHFLHLPRTFNESIDHPIKLHDKLTLICRNIMPYCEDDSSKLSK
jgi:hypothetical protein